MATYVVNGTEYTSKSAASSAIFKELENGDVTVSKPVEGEETATPAPVDGSGYQGPEVII